MISPQVAGAAVIFEVQRSSRSEARKEELRRQELEVFGVSLPFLTVPFFCFLNQKNCVFNSFEFVLGYFFNNLLSSKCIMLLLLRAGVYDFGIYIHVLSGLAHSKYLYSPDAQLS